MAKRKATRKKSKPAKRSRPRPKSRAAEQPAGPAAITRVRKNNSAGKKAGTAAEHIALARKFYEGKLAAMFIAKRKAKTKTARNKIAKKMRGVARQLNRLK